MSIAYLLLMGALFASFKNKIKIVYVLLSADLIFLLWIFLRRISSQPYLNL